MPTPERRRKARQSVALREQTTPRQNRRLSDTAPAQVPLVSGVHLLHHFHFFYGCVFCVRTAASAGQSHGSDWMLPHDEDSQEEPEDETQMDDEQDEMKQSVGNDSDDYDDDDEQDYEDGKNAMPFQCALCALVAYCFAYGRAYACLHFHRCSPLESLSCREVTRGQILASVKARQIDLIFAIASVKPVR